jgi:adenylosuccinate synthase
MIVDVLLGLQWGDEGKGKIVDVLAPDYDIITRFQGGPNAGHTIEFDNQKFILHTIPSGIFNEQKINLIGNGVILDPHILIGELDNLEKKGIRAKGNLLISRKAHLILPSHRLLDAVHEHLLGASKIGSTLKGIGPAYTDKYARSGLRVGDLCEESFKEKYTKYRDKHLSTIHSQGIDADQFTIDGKSFSDYEKEWLEAAAQIQQLNLVDSEYFINQKIREGNKILAEGAQGTMLDVDFGSYPFVTSSNTITSGVCSGLGISPKKIGKVMGVFKAYCTRVGSGPFPTELNDNTGEELRSAGHEFGSTTGRPRRCGWLDLVALRYAIMLNGVDTLFMMKTDVLNELDLIQTGIAYKFNGITTDQVPFDLGGGDYIPVLRDFKGWKKPIAVSSDKDLPIELEDYISFIESFTNLPVEIISYGPDREQTLFRKVES